MIIISEEEGKEGRAVGGSRMRWVLLGRGLFARGDGAVGEREGRGRRVGCRRIRVNEVVPCD